MLSNTSENDHSPNNAVVDRGNHSPESASCEVRAVAVGTESDDYEEFLRANQSYQNLVSAASFGPAALSANITSTNIAHGTALNTSYNNQPIPHNISSTSQNYKLLLDKHTRRPQTGLSRQERKKSLADLKNKLHSNGLPYPPPGRTAHDFHRKGS